MDQNTSNINLASGNNPQSSAIYADLCSIIEHGQATAFAAANQSAIATYWNIGRRIVEEEQQGRERAVYGSRLIPLLSEQLKVKYGTGYGRRNLAYYRLLYLAFPDFKILHARVQNLEWTHVRRILSVSNHDARLWYLQEANANMWSTRELDRNISTQYCERCLAAGHNPKPIAGSGNNASPMHILKNPVVAEFLGFRRDSHFSESELEQALISNLEKFIMELGKGFAFVERQQHIATDSADFYIDLVFYNFKLKCFVLFELKTHTLSHQDIGQLDMYVRMYDDLMKSPDDNPTIGILLCSDTDKTIARYSVLNNSGQLYAAKYMAYMPTEEELAREIDKQREFFRQHHSNE